MRSLLNICLSVKKALGVVGRGREQALIQACEVPPEGFKSDVFMRIRSDMRYVSPVRAVVDAVCGDRLSQDAREDLKLAVGEAVCNAIEHGSPQRERDFVCIACTVNGDGVTVSVSDSGGRFVEKRRRRRPEKLHERGYGLLLIRKLTSAASIKSNGRGATITLEKRSSPTG